MGCLPYEAAPLAGGGTLSSVPNSLCAGLRQTSMKTEKPWALPSSSPVTASQQAALTQKDGDTMDTDFVEIGSPGENS
jgi:hypothetical protein